LAAILVPKGVIVIDPRGEEYTAEIIGERSSVRNFMDSLRSTGVETGAIRPMGLARSRRSRTRSTGFSPALLELSDYRTHFAVDTALSAVSDPSEAFFAGTATRSPTARFFEESFSSV